MSATRATRWSTRPRRPSPKWATSSTPLTRARSRQKLASLKTALSGTDTEAIKKATEELTQAFYKVSEKMYQQANPQGAQGNPGAGYTDPGAQQGQQQGGQYYDADYEVVDDDKDKK